MGAVAQEYGWFPPGFANRVLKLQVMEYVEERILA